MGSGIEAIDKANELLSVMTVCRHNSYFGVKTHTSWDVPRSKIRRLKILEKDLLWRIIKS